MSKTRFIVRSLLVVLLIGVCWIVFRAWSRGQPSHYWNKAQVAMAEDDHQSAKLYLQNLLRNFPDHDEGHQAMAEVLLAEAKAADRPHTYARVPEARSHLIQAADLRPEDLDLQKQVMSVFMDVGAVGEAVEFATRVVELEPDNVAARYATAWQAVVDNDADRAQPLLDQLIQTDSPDYFYRTLVSTVRLYTPRDTDQNNQDAGRPPRQKALATAARRAMTASGEELAALSGQEYVAMQQLIQTAISEAEDVPRVHQAARTALDICEKIAAADESRANNLAFSAGQIMTLLGDNHPLADQAAAVRTTRRQLSEQADRLWAAAIARGEASPRIYLWSASAAMARGEHEAANVTIQKGLATDKGESDQAKDETLRMHLLAARNLMIMRRYDDMPKHLEPLLANEEYEGWGRLISGGVATGQGRHERALNQYLLAERTMGKNVLVELGLASTYLKLRRWSNALPLMQALQGVLDSSNAEQQAWQSLHNAFEEQLHWGQLQANLALDRWAEAQPHLQALGSHPKLGPRALSAAALFLWAKNGRSEAAAIVAAARKAFPRDLRLLHLQAIMWWQDGRIEDADQLIEGLAENARDDLPSQMYLVRWRIRRGKADEAIALLEELIARFPLQPAPLMLKARVLLATGKPREAAALAEKLRESPQTAKLAGLLDVATEISQQNLPEAADRLQAVADSLPSSSPAVSLWEGRIAAAQGDFAEAVAAVGDSLDVTNLRQQARLTLLRSLMLLAVQEGPAKAYDELAPLLERNPEDYFLRIVEADLKFKQGMFDEGIRALDEVERLQPDRPIGAYLKAAAWAQRNDINRALEGIERALRIDDQHVASHTLAAQLNLADARHENAIQHAQTILEKNPNQWQMYLIQADALNQLDRRPQAIALLEQVVEKQPRFLAAHRGLVMLHLTDQQPGQAIAACQRARQAMPEVFTLITDEISILCQQNELETAQQLAEDVVGDPPDAAKCVIIGQAFKAAGQVAAAKEWGERAMELADENLQPTVHLLLGELALSEGQSTSNRELLAKSRDHFAAVHKVQPTHFIAGNNLAWLLATEFDEPDKALEVVDQVRGQATVGQMPLGFVDTLAVVYRKANQLEKAQKILEEAIEYQPNQAKLLFHLGMVLADRNRRVAARTSLERALQLQGLSDVEVNQARRKLQTLDQQAATSSDIQ